jgi:HAD superfamily hydrolase (TIGR01490 family)
MEPVIAAFDVDGTLTTRDTLLPFLVRACGRPKVAIALGRQPWVAASAAVGRRDRADLKAAVLARLLADADAAALSDLGQQHASTIVERWLRPDTLGRLRWHQAEGHQTVLVSASLGCYLHPLGRALGVDDVLCTELEVGPDGRLTGRIDGANCRGQVKADRFQARFGADVRLGYAYGDTAGDRQLLALAERAERIGRRSVPVRPALVER